MSINKEIYIGSNLRALREELGMSLRDVGRIMKVSHTVIQNHEATGFCLPPWARYAEVYKDHPDMRGGGNPIFMIADPNLILESTLFIAMSTLFGRDKLQLCVSKLTNKAIVDDLQDVNKDYRWSESDIECIRVRLGLVPKRHGKGHLSIG